MALQAVKLLASYHAGGRDAKEMALVQLKEWLSSPRAATEAQLQSAEGSARVRWSDAASLAVEASWTKPRGM